MCIRTTISISIEYVEQGKVYIEKQDKVTKVIKFRIENFTGKVSPATDKKID